jgi:unconventional SNARE in the endoplasmic reticulum protein 1
MGTTDSVDNAKKISYLLVFFWLLQILDSTERAVEHSLASTGRATSRAAEVYSLTSKTTCFQWLLIFMMTCMFFMVVLLIRIT